MLIGPINSGVAAGGAGVATATGESSQVIRWMLVGVQVKYNDAPPAGTTDITVKTKGTNAPVITLLAIANAATDGLFLPRYDSCKAADGSALTTNDQFIPIEDVVQVVIAGADDADNIDVWLYLLS